MRDDIYRSHNNKVDSDMVGYIWFVISIPLLQIEKLP